MTPMPAPGHRHRGPTLLRSTVLATLLLVRAGTGHAAESPQAGPGTPEAPAGEAAATPDAMHLDLFIKNRFPSAIQCKGCHEQHFKEWAVSQHAYAMMSPVFVSMQKATGMLTNGTNGDFCIRCHNPIGMTYGEKISMNSLDRNEISLEGITCIACHRMNEEYGKASGRFLPDEGEIYDPVRGPRGPELLQKAIQDGLALSTRPGETGQAVHRTVVPFFYISKSGFCGSCHDVNNLNGFRLEEAFSDFKHSPAAGQKQSCQDCHMSTEQGKPSGYATGPAAVIAGKPTADRKITNHFFAGPDYSAIHPGLFPFNKDAREFATPKEWVQFDHRAGWGTPEFEDDLPEGTTFPERWELYEERESARFILDQQFERLAWAREQRRTLLRNALQIGEIDIREDSDRELEFAVQVQNITGGHAVPTGFSAERVFWLHVTVTDADGKKLLESGDLDPNGDLRDSHSTFVHERLLPQDDLLFNLQSRFLTNNVRGGERHEILPINFSVDPLPFLRPSTFAAGLLGRPAGARIQRKGISPHKDRWARYEVDRSRLSGRRPYRIQVEFKATMVPVHLVNAIAIAGYDYGMSPRDVAEGVVQGHLVFDQKELLVGEGSAIPGAGE